MLRSSEIKSSDGSELLDLVIIDEAQYLRNPATAANYLATLLASAASLLVLLTATPIQLGSENLFQLLTLLDADRYANLDRQQAHSVALLTCDPMPADRGSRNKRWRG